VVSLFTKAPDRALVDDAFSCYEQKVVVTSKTALGDASAQEEAL
jgi:SSS family solute:Na+ symporter